MAPHAYGLKADVCSSFRHGADGLPFPRPSQATLEIEFMHQTLSQHVSDQADKTLQSIYKTISQSYYRRPNSSAQELQQELEGLKRTLVASRRATALQFLCFRRPSKAPAGPPGGAGSSGGAGERRGATTEAATSRRGAVVPT